MNKTVAFAKLAAMLFPMLDAATAGAAVTPWVGLNTTQGFAILTETGVTDVPTSAIVGNVGVSPITGAANHLTCSEVKGRTFAVNAAGAACSVVAPATLTTAISDMRAAYADAASGTPTVKELGAGNIGGLALTPCVYAWSSRVLIQTTVTLQGTVSGKGNVWIFKIGKTLNLANAASISLSRGAQVNGYSGRSQVQSRSAPSLISRVNFWAKPP